MPVGWWGALGDTKGWLERENRMQLYCFIIQMVVNIFAFLGEKVFKSIFGSAVLLAVKCSMTFFGER